MAEFEKIYQDYFNDVYLYIRKLSGYGILAEEITDETFFKAMRSVSGFRGDCDIRVWLCQIAKNCYYSHRKKFGRIDNIDDAGMFELISGDDCVTYHRAKKMIKSRLEEKTHEK